MPKYRVDAIWHSDELEPNEFDSLFDAMARAMENTYNRVDYVHDMKWYRAEGHWFCMAGVDIQGFENFPSKEWRIVESG